MIRRIEDAPYRKRKCTPPVPQWTGGFVVVKMDGLLFLRCSGQILQSYVLDKFYNRQEPGDMLYC